MHAPCNQALAAHGKSLSTRLCTHFQQSNGHLGIHSQTLAYPRPSPPPVVDHLQLHTASYQTGGGEGQEMKLANQLAPVLGIEIVRLYNVDDVDLFYYLVLQCPRVQVILLTLWTLRQLRTLKNLRMSYQPGCVNLRWVAALTAISSFDCSREIWLVKSHVTRATMNIHIGITSFCGTDGWSVKSSMCSM